MIPVLFLLRKIEHSSKPVPYVVFKQVGLVVLELCAVKYYKKSGWYIEAVKLKVIFIHPSL